MKQENTHTVLDLAANAADISTDHSGFFPHGLGDRKSETFAKRLLKDYSRGALKRIDER